MGRRHVEVAGTDRCEVAGGREHVGERALGASDRYTEALDEPGGRGPSHRWDLAGDDEVSAELLRQLELTAHAVTVLNTMPPDAPESPDHRALAARVPPTRATFGSPGQPDVVVIRDTRGARFVLADPVASPTASADPATRLLALWGRRTSAGVIRWSDDTPAADHLRSLLWSHLPGRPETTGRTVLPDRGDGPLGGLCGGVGLASLAGCNGAAGARDL